MAKKSNNSPLHVVHHVAADYLPWATMLNLVNWLFRDKKYVMSAFIATASFTGLRVSDIKRITWAMLLDDEKFTIVEQKTNKTRVIKVNVNLKSHIQACYDALKIEDKNEPFLVSQKGTVYSTQRLNVVLKEMKEFYKLKDIDHFSCHSLRKTFGRRVVEMAGENSEMAIIKLAELFQHVSTKVTRRYLALRQVELLQTYDDLL